MSRAATRKPESRLHLGYPDIFLVESATGRTILRARQGDASFARDLGRMAAAASGMRLTVVLPEEATWRAELEDTSGNLADIRGLARQRAAQFFGIPEPQLTIAVGSVPAGAVSVAAVQLSVLGEARDFLARTGFHPVAITAAADLPAFPHPARWIAKLPALPLRSPLARAAAGGLAASVGVWLFAVSGPGPDLAPAVEVADKSIPVVEAAAEIIAAPRHRPANFVPRQPEPETKVAATPVRPAPEIAAAPVKPAAPIRSAPPPVTVAPAPVTMAPAPVTMASRSVADLPAPSALARAPAPDRLSFALPKLQAARDRIAETLRTAPLILGMTPAASLAPDRALRIVELRPVERPVTDATLQAAVPSVQPTPARVVEAGRPRPRPGGASGAAPALSAAITEAVAAAAAEPVRTAALGSATALTDAARPAPRRIAAIAVETPKAVFTPQPPTVTRTAVAAPAPAPVVQTIPAPTRQVVVARPAPAIPRAAPATPVPQNVGLQRNEISLVGVFGSPSKRRAILRLPNGKMTKVQAGDRVDGARVAAVGTDSVRLSGRSQDVLLKLP